MQTSQVIAHEELMLAKAAMEHLAAPYFLTYENVSIKDGDSKAKDLTVSFFFHSFLIS